MTMLDAMRQRGEFSIRRVRPDWYRLERKGDLFPLASGPIGFIRKNFARLTAPTSRPTTNEGER